MSIRGVRAVVVVECIKLAAQFKTSFVLGISIVGPFLFAAALSIQSSMPTDTLFGRAVKESGFAVSLVVLAQQHRRHRAAGHCCVDDAACGDG